MIVGKPFQDPKQLKTKNSADWIVVEKGTSIIHHHRFTSLEAAEEFVTQKTGA